MLLETDCSSEAFKENVNILLLLTGSFPPKPLKNTAHGLPKISRNLSSNGPFWNLGIKQGKMGTETLKIALNVRLHVRTANQQMSRPERHVDDITDMRRSCRLRENTSGRRPLRSSSRLLKVPNNKLRTTIYRKPTHTDRLLDQPSYNPTSQKATTIRSLTRRAQLEYASVVKCLWSDKHIGATFCTGFDHNHNFFLWIISS